jgi:hypothetical protein
MNTEKTSLRARAVNLFAAEERNQELMGLALLQQHGDYQTLEEAANPSANRRSLEALVLDSDQNILAIQHQLQNARNCAAQLQAKDEQLGALNQLIYSCGQSRLVDEDIIEGEIIEEVGATKATVAD